MALRLFCQSTASGHVLSGFGRPFGIGLDTAGRLLIADMDCHLLIRLTQDHAAYQCHDGQSGWGPLCRVSDGLSSERPRLQPRGLNGPHSVDGTEDGGLMVVCYYEPQLASIGADGSMTRLVGRECLSGPATGRLDCSGRVWVAEYAQNLVLVFDQAGTYLGRMGRGDTGELLFLDSGRRGVSASQTAGGLDRPHMAIPLHDGAVLVADTWNHRLQKFRPDEKIVFEVDMAAFDEYDTHARRVRAQRLPLCPVALDEDAQGRILVTDWANSQILLIGHDGGGAVRLPLPKLNQPYDARFYRQGLVVADSGAGRVVLMNQVYE